MSELKEYLEMALNYWRKKSKVVSTIKVDRMLIIVEAG